MVLHAQPRAPAETVASVRSGEGAKTTAGYINASFLPGLAVSSPDYITAQGPTPATVGHFWKMVAEYRVRVIVMLTRVTEGGRAKCEEYWPPPGAALTVPADEYGPAVTVTAAPAEHQAAFWTEREWTVASAGAAAPITVTQLHFTDWPDHGVPVATDAFLHLVYAAMNRHTAARAVRFWVVSRRGATRLAVSHVFSGVQGGGRARVSHGGALLRGRRPHGRLLCRVLGAHVAAVRCG